MATPKAGVFISHNIADRDFGRKLAAALALAGSRVWYDEWSVRPGDSIPHAVENGLAGFNTFALLWSRKASKSRLVQTEMETAFTKMIKKRKYRLVPIPLDDTPLPGLLQRIKYIDGRDGDHIRVARELLNIDSDAAFRLAVQQFIGEAGIKFSEFWAWGF